MQTTTAATARATTTASATTTTTATTTMTQHSRQRDVAGEGSEKLGDTCQGAQRTEGRD